MAKTSNRRVLRKSTRIKKAEALIELRKVRQKAKSASAKKKRSQLSKNGKASAGKRSAAKASAAKKKKTSRRSRKK